MNVNRTKSENSNTTLRWLASKTLDAAKTLQEASIFAEKSAELQLMAIEKIEHLVLEETQKNGTLSSE